MPAAGASPSIDGRGRSLATETTHRCGCSTSRLRLAPETQKSRHLRSHRWTRGRRLSLEEREALLELGTVDLAARVALSEHRERVGPGLGSAAAGSKQRIHDGCDDERDEDDRSRSPCHPVAHPRTRHRDTAPVSDSAGCGSSPGDVALRTSQMTSAMAASTMTGAKPPICVVTASKTLRSQA